MVRNKLQVIYLTTNWGKIYKRDVFDCSNMSSTLKQMFPEYESKILVGKHYINNARHAVLKINIGGRWYYLNSTNLILYDQIPAFNWIYEYNSIEEACNKYNKAEFKPAEFEYDETKNIYKINI